MTDPAFDTHEVFNQPPPLEPYNSWQTDPVLQDLVGRYSDWGRTELDAYGAICGDELAALGVEANRHKPVLHTHDRYGHRIDEVRFHPAYHRIMELGVAHGVHALPWQRPEPGAHVVRAGLEYLHHQAEAGTNCPLTMTYASVPALKHAPALAEQWLPKIVSGEYDPGFGPMAEKAGVTLGMGMTEKQGGSDVRVNTTLAQSIGGDDYELVGHKWFFSAPMCDAFLVLAQLPEGPSCFLLPRWRPDGSLNAIRIQRLKDKLGNWSNASSEVEFQRAFAQRVGEPGRGVATILEMVSLTRLDCIVGSAAEMRQALVQAVHHCNHRQAFGKRLVQQPLMRQVLADLALELEGHAALMMRVAAAVDRAGADPQQAAFARLGTAIGKFWVCKRAPAFVNEAQECLGGAGYVEESVLPRLYREAPLNSIWEGSGNVQCLDMLRAIRRDPESLAAVRAEIESAAADSPTLAAALADLDRLLSETDALEVRARLVAERLALSLQAALLLRHAPGGIAEAFGATRLAGEGARGYGATRVELPVQDLIARAWPDAAT